MAKLPPDFPPQELVRVARLSAGLDAWTPRSWMAALHLGFAALWPQRSVKAEIVLLAVPFNTYQDVAEAAESWNGKTVIDVTNAYGVSPEKLGNRPSSAVIA
jgi:predicted dinucleotide-binding enzyme